MQHTIYDISLPLNTRTKVFPGDTPLQYRFIQNIQQGNDLNLSDFSTTTHIGTHADSPLHYINEAQPIGEMDLNLFIGKCLVIKVNSNIQHPIDPTEISQYNPLPQRVLFCTTNHNNYTEWTPNYRALSVELVDYLYKNGVKLIGVDTPSVDAFESTNSAIHKQIFAHHMVILENLYLNHIPEGEYELIALPLKFTELEASPIRAILRTLYEE